jgi:hypothetical protein
MRDLLLPGLMFDADGDYVRVGEPIAQPAFTLQDLEAARDLIEVIERDRGSGG